MTLPSEFFINHFIMVLHYLMKNIENQDSSGYESKYFFVLDYIKLLGLIVYGVGIKTNQEKSIKSS